MTKVKEDHIKIKFTRESLIELGSAWHPCPDRCARDNIFACLCSPKIVKTDTMLYGLGYRVYMECENCGAVWATKEDVDTTLPIKVEWILKNKEEIDKWCEGKSDKEIRKGAELSVDDPTNIKAMPQEVYGWDTKTLLYKVLVDVTKKLNNAVFDRIKFEDNILKLPWRIEVDDGYPFGVDVYNCTGEMVIGCDMNVDVVTLGKTPMMELVKIANEYYENKNKRKSE